MGSLSPHVEHFGAENPSASRVIIVHGTLDRAASFRKVQRLLPDLNVTLVDRRGYGASSAQAPAVDAEQGAADILAIVGGSPASIVGHSFGGLLAIIAAIEQPELVRSIGVYEPPQPWQPWWPEITPARPVGGFPDDPGEAVEVFFGAMVGPDAWDAMPLSFREARMAEGEAMLSDLRAAHLRCPYDLADLLTPMVAASGGASLHHYQQSADQLAAESSDGTRFTIAGAQHGGHLSHPADFAAFVRAVVALRTD